MRTSVHMETTRGRNPDYVQSLERGLAVIRAFGVESPELRLSDVARATGLTRAAARRFLLTLVRLGYVRQDGNTFSLRPRVLELGYAYLSALSLPEVAQPHMGIVSEVNESSSVAVLDDLEVVYVARVPTQRIMTIIIAVGTRFPRLCDVDGARAPCRSRAGGARRAARPGRDRAADGDDRAHPGSAPGADRGGPRGRLGHGRPGAGGGVRSAAVPIRDTSAGSSPR